MAGRTGTQGTQDGPKRFPAMPGAAAVESVIPPHGLPAILRIPTDPFALVIFAHGSGSSHLSPRNTMVAEALGREGMATLLFDLLLPEEEPVHNRANVFNIDLLAGRLIEALDWAMRQPGLEKLPIGLFGASTGAAAALVVAARMGGKIGAVVSRGGRPDLAGADLKTVRAPTLLIVGGADHGVIELNLAAFEQLTGAKSFEVIPGATHVFPEPGAMEQVTALAARWFMRHLHG
jgi:dienelactone hydrolase